MNWKLLCSVVFVFCGGIASAQPVTLKCSGQVTGDKDTFAETQKVEKYNTSISIIVDRSKMTVDIHGDWGCSEPGLKYNVCSGKFPVYQDGENGELELFFNKETDKQENSTLIKLNQVTGVFTGTNLITIKSKSGIPVSTRFWEAKLQCAVAEKLF
jgi:hypothetical protein